MVSTGDAAIVDAEIDLCTLGACYSADAIVVSQDLQPEGEPNQCPSLASYRAEQDAFHSDAIGGNPACAPVETWSEAVAYFCIHGSFSGRYLNCNGLNAIVFGSVEFSTIFVYDSTTLKLVDLVSEGPYQSQLPIGSNRRCVAGEVPALDPATCESFTTGPCQ